MKYLVYNLEAPIIQVISICYFQATYGDRIPTALIFVTQIGCRGVRIFTFVFIVNSLSDLGILPVRYHCITIRYSVVHRS
jgi:hypothetical protein